MNTNTIAIQPATPDVIRLVRPGHKPNHLPLRRAIPRALPARRRLPIVWQTHSWIKKIVVKKLGRRVAQKAKILRLRK